MKCCLREGKCFDWLQRDSLLIHTCFLWGHYVPFLARWPSLIAFCGIAKKAEEKANQIPGTLVCDKRCMLLNGFFFFFVQHSTFPFSMDGHNRLHFQSLDWGRRGHWRAPPDQIWCSGFCSCNQHTWQKDLSARWGGANITHWRGQSVLPDRRLISHPFKKKK